MLEIVKTPPPRPKREINWDKIRDDYQRTDCTVRSLASKHHVPFAIIEARAIEGQWPRDINKEIQAATTFKTATQGMDVQVQSGQQSITEADRLEIINNAANQIADVIGTHKSATAQGIGLIKVCLERMQQIGQSVEISEVKELSVALKNFVSIDRATYKLDDYKGLGSASDIEKRSDDDRAARRESLIRMTEEMLDRAQSKLRVVK